MIESETVSSFEQPALPDEHLEAMHAEYLGDLRARVGRLMAQILTTSERLEDPVNMRPENQAEMEGSLAAAKEELRVVISDPNARFLLQSK